MKTDKSKKHEFRSHVSHTHGICLYENDSYQCNQLLTMHLTKQSAGVVTIFLNMLAVQNFFLIG